MKSTKNKKYISFIELKDKSIIKGNIDVVNKWNFLDTDELNFSRKLIIESYDENEKIYNNLINIFQKHLNRIHKTQYSTKYWEFIIGPWLKLFIDVIRIKWQSILISSHQHINYILNDLIPKNNLIKNYKKIFIPYKNYLRSITEVN